MTPARTWPPPLLAGLARRWPELTAPALEWSLDVGEGGCAPRSKWSVWTGPRPPDPHGLCREAGLAHLLPADVDPGRLHTLGVGIDGERPVCLYLDRADAAAPGGRRLEQVGADVTVTYTFHRLPAAVAGPDPAAALPAARRALVATLLADPLVAGHSGFWLRGDQPRVYVTFPHHPPVRQLRALLGDALDTTALAEHDDRPFRHVSVHPEGRRALTVYFSGRSTAFPSGPEDLRDRVSVWGRTVFTSPEARGLVQRAQLARL